MENKLTIYNTLSRQKELFVPLHAPHVGMYVCGPTVSVSYTHLDTVLLKLLQTIILIEESPADKIESASELPTKFFRTLHIGNLLEEFVGCREVSQFQIGQVSAVAYFVNPVSYTHLIL